jgi:hypothetical protein
MEIIGISSSERLQFRELRRFFSVRRILLVVQIKEDTSLMSGMRCEYGEASMVEGEFLYILRLMLPRKVANEKGVHYAIALSGPRSDRYIGRYTQPDAQSMAETIDEHDYAAGERY